MRRNCLGKMSVSDLGPGGRGVGIGECWHSSQPAHAGRWAVALSRSLKLARNGQPPRTTSARSWRDWFAAGTDLFFALARVVVRASLAASKSALQPSSVLAIIAMVTVTV